MVPFMPHGTFMPLFSKAVDFDLDHIVPRAHGGDDKPGNLQLLCRQCNTGKGAGR